jgi:putative membrane protein
MQRFLIRFAINAVALYAAIAIVPGITPQSTNWLTFVWLALIFGVINALLRPVLALLTCPLIILTLGLFTLLINTLMFYLSGLIGRIFGVGFTVDSFWAAFLGALVTSVVSIVLSMLFRDELSSRRARNI